MTRLIDADALKEKIIDLLEIEWGYEGIREDVSRIIDSMPTTEERPHGEWKPCSERLPEEGVNHLGWIERDSWVDGDDYPTRKQEIAIGWHIEGRWHFDGCNGKTKCIAWMPLPEPYREETSE